MDGISGAPEGYANPASRLFKLLCNTDIKVDSLCCNNMKFSNKYLKIYFIKFENGNGKCVKETTTQSKRRQ